MTFEFRILPEEKLILERLAGTHDAASILEGVKRLWADPLYDPGFDLLCDLNSASPSLSPRAAIELSNFFRSDKRSTRGRQAIVTNNPIITALTMIYLTAMPAGTPFKIFSTFEAASKFLGKAIPDPLTF